MPGRLTRMISLRSMNTQRWRPFLSWHRQHQQERKGTVVLLILVLIVYIVRYCLAHQTEVIIEKAQTQVQQKNPVDSTHGPLSDKPNNTFTPANSSAEHWRRAGLSDKKAKSIMKYLHQGGRINSAKDLDRIYCLNEQEKQMLKSQLQFSIDTFQTSGPRHAPLKRQPMVVELNTADTAQLMQLPGIGKWFARKIIERRDLLGGFYDEQQLLEVYRMTQGKIDTLYDYIRVDARKIQRIRINQVHPDTLAMHPYFRRKLAHTICSYRDKHGRYNDMKGLAQAVRLDSLEFQKLGYYLQFY